MIDKFRPYEEHHFQDVEDVGVAFDGTRVWVCINGIALLRAKVFPEGLSVEYNEPFIALLEAKGGQTKES